MTTTGMTTTEALAKTLNVPGPRADSASSADSADSTDSAGTPVLEVRDLHVEFKTSRTSKTRDAVVKAVNGVSYRVRAGRDPRRARRVRLGQVRDGTGRHGHPRHRLPGG